MRNKTKIVAGSAAALAILLAGGLAVALPAQADNAAKSTSVVGPVDSKDTDSVQNEVEDGTSDGETADDVEVEDPSDDIGGVAVEDGTQD